MLNRPPYIEEIRAEVAKFTDKKIKAGEFSRVFPSGPDAGLLRTKKASDWMKQEYGKPLPKKLFDGFWFEGELCIMFADTNLGKSVLAVHIADSLTKNYSIGPFVNQAANCTVLLYIDFELGAKQFELRYFDNQFGSHHFSDGFYRAEFNPAAYEPYYHGDYEKYFNNALENAIKNLKPQVLIIDNITYMGTGTERAKEALPLMKSLKALKNKYKLSVLALAHTPKRDRFKPITVNDLQGSKMLINFADSAFAIGQSQTTPGMRYLKQIKQRNQAEQYGANNVCLIKQTKEHAFLGYEFVGYDQERNHLRRPGDAENEENRQRIIALHQAGFSLRQIAAEVGVHFSTVGRIVKEGL